MGKHIKILLVDDNEVFRQGLRHLLDSEKDMEVVGTCGTAESAFSHLEITNVISPYVECLSNPLLHESQYAVLYYKIFS